MRLQLSFTKLFLGLAAIFILSAKFNPALAQPDTIRLKDKRLNTSKLKPGLRQYLVYFQNAKSTKNLRFWFWLRNTQNSIRDGKKVLITTQHWYGSDTGNYRTAYSVNNLNDFAPVYHAETISGKLKAYNWGADKITSADTVKQNTLQGFLLMYNEPNFNWNLDIETFEMLPLATDKTFAINFYDAGTGKPEFIIYKVIGNEVITTYGNKKVDCWKLFTESDNNGRHFTETYWISKQGHEFLKEEDAFGGGYRYKIKMPAAAPDLLSRFNK